MRFKELRMNVAASIILFIFIVGNIIIFRALSKSRNSDSGLNLLAPVYSNESKVSSSQSDNAVIAQGNQIAVQTDSQTAAPSMPVIISTVRTRDS